MRKSNRSAHTLNPARKTRYCNASNLSNTPFTYGGIRIYVDHPSPKVFVGRFWWLSDEVRNDIQLRMIALFGYNKGVVERGQVLMIGDKAIVHPADMAILKNAA